MPDAIASHYARALADILIDGGQLFDSAQALEQLKAFEEALATSRELHTVMLNPSVPAARKRAVAAALLPGDGHSRVIRNLAFVLIDNRRTAELRSIREALEEELDRRKGVRRAVIRSARPLSAEQQAQLEQQLARLSGGPVRGVYAVDPELLGGVVVRLGSRMYDGSVRGQLAMLRRRLSR